MLKSLAIAVIALCPVLANADGTLNPEEMTIGRMMDNIRNGHTDMTTCASGYFITKSGRHVMARELFEACAEAGYTGAMTWMSQLDNNGLGGDYDPEAAADWDRRAADAGDPVGQFNLGLNMIRGHGVRRDVEQGQRWIDTAAESGLPVARRMQASGYDPDEVTPDADNWKYAPLF
ncbi:tetratricopeptide repeat protein [Ruegeria sp. HKCCD8929]|uniref:tetratricopeptide repeat protein n=1 Tax=Ruegeria sp. HKCCD8929 TaxID=2683006 RepID=UPI001489CD1E|nr:sel1 repeat family protein [Ruegeria sp. HKCCD8929]